jgi:hypothetical protein
MRGLMSQTTLFSVRAELPVVKRNGSFQIIRVPQCWRPALLRRTGLLGWIDAGPAVFPIRVLF